MNSNIQQQVTELLYNGELKSAIELLEGIITADRDWELYTRLMELQTAYGYMLEYMRKGMPDPNRETLYNSLIGKCFIINDEFAVCDSSLKPEDIYTRYRRTYGNSTEVQNIHERLLRSDKELSGASMKSNPDVALRERNDVMLRRESLVKEAFYRLWVSRGWKSGECDEIYSLLTDRAIRSNDRATFVSAIMLGAMKCFEPKKIIVLSRLAQCGERAVAMRALIGMLIILMVYERRISYYPELKSALQLLGDEKGILRRILTTQIQLLRCRETQKIDRKMREEIIPAMMKNPNLSNNKLGADIAAEIEEIERNPEWKSWMEQDNIKDKLDEMAKWQIEGADVYMSTFSQLKSFPFFGEICNWFRPFDTEIPAVSSVIPHNATSGKSIIAAICSSHFFCNSDKYSFCFTLQQVPEEQRSMMMQQLPGAENMGHDDGHETVSLVSEEQEAERIGNQYIQDLYRFFKLSRHRREFFDPFALPLNLLECEELSFFVNEPNAMMEIFHYLIEKEYFDEAFRVGSDIERRDKNLRDAQFFQKMGYSLQKSGKYKEAIEYYIKADIFAPDTLWTMRQIAQCYRLTGDFENALRYYIATEDIDPDNLSLHMMTGECLAVLKRYDEAFEHFFKVDYLDHESLRAWRAIAWCSFLTRNDEQARHYYDKLMQHPKARCEDFMNAAHVEWIAKNCEKAYTLYKKAEEMCGSAKFKKMMDDDRATLIERGAQEYELQLLRDIIRE